MKVIKESGGSESKSNFTTSDMDVLKAYADNQKRLENKPTLSEKEKLGLWLQIRNKELAELTQQINSARKESEKIKNDPELKKIKNEISTIENYGETIQNSTEKISTLFDNFLNLKLSDFWETKNELIEESPVEEYFGVKSKNDILQTSKTPEELWKNITNSRAWSRDITRVIEKLKTYIENKEKSIKEIEKKVQKQEELREEIQRLQSEIKKIS